MSEQNDDPDRTVTADAMRARTGDMLPGKASDPGGTVVQAHRKASGARGGPRARGPDVPGAA